MTAPIVRQLDQLRTLSRDWSMAGETVGVVPTMGALHDGHLSLVAAAKEACDRVIVTIFVNPKQFNNPEDLEKYPRTENEDAQKLEPFDVDLIYVPEPDQVYPSGFATNVSVSGMTDVMEGRFRPGHFDGVATVVAKLFLQTAADKAFFGQKDYQQLMLVTRMARDLDIPIEVIGCPTVREASGLAMSSRNLRLSPEGLEKAAHLSRVMQAAADGLKGGASFETLAGKAKLDLEQAGFVDIEYFDLRSATSLETLDRPTEPARLLAAAWMEGVRLIDNIAVSEL